MERKGSYCPFCGAYDSTFIKESMGLTTRTFVECATCGARGPVVNFSDSTDVNSDAVIDLWNTRVSITRKRLKS